MSSFVFHDFEIVISLVTKHNLAIVLRSNLRFCFSTKSNSLKDVITSFDKEFLSIYTQMVSNLATSIIFNQGTTKC